MQYTFLFTDIEGSTRSWERDRRGMSEFLRLHDEMMRKVIGEHDGSIVKHTGDGVFAHFTDPFDAVRCAVAIQRELSGLGVKVDGRSLRARMGLHCGSSEVRGEDHFGPSVNLAQRIMDAANGGQVLLSGQLVDLLADLEEPFGTKDLGVHRLRDLSEPRRLFLLLHPDLAEGSGISLRTLSSVPNNLQRPLTPFVGRERELHDIRSLLADDSARLLTLHGHGGTGKTRLALQSAALEAFSFPGGVFFVQLDKVHSAELIGSAVAEALGLEPSGPETEDLVIGHMRRRRMLLVLDNYEHLAPNTEFLSRLLVETEDPCILVTSRSRLQLSSEHVYPLDGLGLPGNHPCEQDTSDSERLYHETARRLSGRDWIEDGTSVREICLRLHGNPLAIILAASWHGVLSPAEILEELKTSLAVSSGLSDLPERHRSLRGVFLFSWNTLDDGEKTALSCLSIFSGPFTRESAGAVCGLNISDLAGLCGKSLLDRNENGTFSIHPLVREFASEKREDFIPSGRMEDIREAHSDYFLGLLVGPEKGESSGHRGDTIPGPSLFIDDILLAWDRAVAGCRYELLIASHSGFRDLLGLRGMYRAGEGIFRKTLEECGSGIDDRTLQFRAWMLLSLGYFSSFCSPGAVSMEHLREAADIFRKVGPSKGLGDSLNMLGNVSYVSGDYDAAYRAYGESLEIRRRLNDRSGVAAVLNNLGNLCCQRMDYSEAEEFYRESIGIERSSGNRHGVSSTLANLAIVKMSQDQPEEAGKLLREALDLEMEIGDSFNIAIVKGIMCSLHLNTGELDAAEAICRENVETYSELGNAWGVADSYCKLGRSGTLKGDVELAADSLVSAMDAIEGRDWNPLALEILGRSAELLASLGNAGEAEALSLFIRQHGSCSAELSIRMEKLLEQTGGTYPGDRPSGLDGDIGDALARTRGLLRSL